MRDSILRVIDDLETRLDDIQGISLNKNDSEYRQGVFAGRITILNYSIQELRKVLDDHAQV